MFRITDCEVGNISVSLPDHLAIKRAGIKTKICVCPHAGISPLSFLEGESFIVKALFRDYE
ncbi:MAG TPA: hypothetical protein DDX85_00330 [Nitrospiraceae bacterium]|nr:hypothetical protein [Nitrospiraceae bacterium]